MEMGYGSVVHERACACWHCRSFMAGDHFPASHASGRGKGAPLARGRRPVPLAAAGRHAIADQPGHPLGMDSAESSRYVLVHGREGPQKAATCRKHSRDSSWMDSVGDLPCVRASRGASCRALAAKAWRACVAGVRVGRYSLFGVRWSRRDRDDGAFAQFELSASTLLESSSRLWHRFVAVWHAGE